MNRSYRQGAVIPLPVRRAKAETKVGSGRFVILGSIVLLITIRLFTEVFGVLPRAANFVDVPLIVGLVAYTALIVKKQTETQAWFRAPAMMFAALWGVSLLVNLQRVEAAPALLFLYGFLTPLLFYFVTLRCWVPGGALLLSRTLVVLGFLQFLVVAGAQVPEFLSTGNPDVITGTFGENPYQLVFFLTVVGAHVAAVAVFEPRRLAARLAVPLLIGSFVVIFMAQYRALVVSTVIALVVTGVLLSRAHRKLHPGQSGRTGRVRAVTFGLIALIALIGAFNFAATRFPELKFLSAIDAFREDPELLLQAGKIDAGKDVLQLYQRQPRYVVLGTGPGTYSSRAWYTFAFFDSTSESNVAGEYVSKLTGGVVYRTDVSEEFVLPRARGQAAVLGSYALTHPFSSYLALAAEIGLIGLALILFIYGSVLRRMLGIAGRAMKDFVSGDSLPALAIAAVIAPLTLLQMAVLDNWLEVTRVAAPTWMLIAIVQVEFNHRVKHGG